MCFSVKTSLLVLCFFLCQKHRKTRLPQFSRYLASRPFLAKMRCLWLLFVFYVLFLCFFVRGSVVFRAQAWWTSAANTHFLCAGVVRRAFLGRESALLRVEKCDFVRRRGAFCRLSLAPAVPCAPAGVDKSPLGAPSPHILRCLFATFPKHLLK